MVAEVEIISRETIKPSSPTPDNLRELKFSFHDQIAIPTYACFVFFYQSPGHDSGQISQTLKKSFSDTLSLFYPFAGKIHENSSVVCDDSGAEFIQARVRDVRLKEIIEEADLNEINRFIPAEALSHKPTNEEVLLLVQVNFFEKCGGVAIGFSVSHKIADATSQVEFARAWAANCRGKVDEISPPVFGLVASHFPPVDLSALMMNSSNPNSAILADRRIAARRVVLGKEKLTDLRSEISSDPESDLTDPTRVEAVTAYMWKQFIDAAVRGKASSVDDGRRKSLIIGTHAVSLRPRMEPPLPPEAFGNCVAACRAFLEVDLNPNSVSEIKLHHLAGHMRTALRRIDGGYVKDMQTDLGGFFRAEYERAGIGQSAASIGCYFSSWVRFPVYEVDYGWGKPEWVCTGNSPVSNVVMLLGTSDGDGIEAWIHMFEDDMKLLQLE